MIMNADEFLKHVTEGARPPEVAFGTHATYSQDGDCIEFLAVAESYYGERIDDLITVFYSHRTGQIIGSLIKGVKAHLRSHPNLIVSIVDQKIRIDHLLISNAATSNKQLDKVTVRVYQRLVKVAEESNAMAEVPNINEELCPA
jgi:hypothetical protein